MEWIRSANPKGHTLESWMRENNFTGDESLGGETLLKLVEDSQGRGMGLNIDVISKL